MIPRYNRMSIAIGLPGFLMQIAAYVIGVATLQAVGTVLLLIGLLLYAQAKGRNPLWCLMAFIPVAGLIVLACLKDLATDGTSRSDRAGTPSEPEPLPPPPPLGPGERMCQHCHAKYKPTDYDRGTATWLCSACKQPLPKEA